MRTVASAEDRLRAMIERTRRAADLLRTRVDVERSAQNQALLERMDRRADLQLRLQHTVEGLSVVAISYYAVGLIGYAVYPVAHAMAIDKALRDLDWTPQFGLESGYQDSYDWFRSGGRERYTFDFSRDDELLARLGR